MSERMGRGAQLRLVCRFVSQLPKAPVAFEEFIALPVWGWGMGAARRPRRYLEYYPAVRPVYTLLVDRTTGPARYQLPLLFGALALTQS